MNMTFVERVEAIVGLKNYRMDMRERTVYSSDIGVMPPLVKPFINAGIPGIVIRPQDEGKVVELVQAAQAFRVPLVVRGGATSGFGGALPREGAAVLDLSGWQDIIEINQEQNQVRCQAGAIWEEVDRFLKKEGLELCLYPSSYPSSTVAGWLAQGGSGFGSYEYGPFKDSVISARIVLPTGEIQEMAGEDLCQLVSEAEGITGVITEVTFKVRPLENTEVRLLSFLKASELAAALIDISESQLPIWSITFFNPKSVELKKKLPQRKHHAYELEEVLASRELESSLPVSYLVLVAIPESRIDRVDAPLCDIVEKHAGTILPEKVALHEWNSRSTPMRLKRIGPSIIPTEVVVPLDQLALVLDEIDQKIHQAFVLEGMLVKGGQVVLLGYIPHDERSIMFNPAFALSLSVMKIANAHGGSGYATGLYFRGQASRVFGEEKIARLRRFKHDKDPAHIMNPGKVISLQGEGGKALDRLMGSAMKMESLIRPFANAAKPKKRKLPPKRNGIPGDVALMATKCARCGYCVPTCEQYSGRGWESESPRGKYAWIKEIYQGHEKWDRASTNTFLLCTTCERCNFRCQLQLPVEHNGMSLRNNVVEGQGMGTFPPFEMMGAALRGEGDIWAGKRKNRANWLPLDVEEKLSEKAEMLYFAGCTASYVESDIAEGTLRLLQDTGIDIAYLGTEESCCGIPMKMAGKWDIFTDMYHRNVAAARARGAKTIVTSCPACALVWKEMYAKEAQRLGEPYEFEVKHYSEIVASALASGKLKLKESVFAGHTVTFHDSCHTGRAQGIYEPPREMLKAIPEIDYVEMEHTREEGMCCGSVVTLVGELPVAPVLGRSRLVEAVEAGADTIIALCPCCQVQLRDAALKNGIDIVVDDLARVVAQAAGHNIPSSTEYTTYMWGVFERFIILMQPENMARFMVPLFPKMIDAMPMNMGGMMRSVGKTNAGSAMMKKAMPAVFPKMAPGILEKVMPDMIQEMEAYFGEMPEDMHDLLPDLLPKTLNELMPTYIPELIPYLVPLFIEYLYEGTQVSEEVVMK